MMGFYTIELALCEIIICLIHNLVKGGFTLQSNFQCQGSRLIELHF